MKRSVFSRWRGIAPLVAGAFLIFSCDTFFDKVEDYPHSREFWAYDWVKEENYRCAAGLLATGTHCLVYGEKGGKVQGNSPDAQLDSALAGLIAGYFDSRIYSQITGAFGAPLDVDGNGKVILLLLDIQDGYDPDTALSYTAGYFYPGDMLASSMAGPDQPRGNGADMLYIDTWPSSLATAGSYGTIAHELQHLISFSQGVVQGRYLDLWIDEGLSTAAEHICTGIQKSRIDWLSHTQNVTASRGNNFFIWNGSWEQDRYNDQLTNYATAYLFFQWLRIHSDNGAAIYKEIINALEGDYRAVTGAASRRIDPRFASWEELLGAWLTASLLQQPTGLKGYIDELPPFTPWYLKRGEGAGHTISLAPGEGVFSRLGSASADLAPGEFIRYGAYSRADGESTLPAAKAGDDLITFNVNTADKADRIESGYVGDPVQTTSAGVRAARGAGISAEISSAEAPVPELYQWDGARYLMDRLKRGPKR